MRFFTLILLVAMIASCSSAVSIGHYSITYEEKESAETTHEYSVGIEKFSSVNSILRHEIILREKTSNKLSYATDSFWWELPQEMVTETLQNYLKSKGLFRNVLPYPTLHKIKYLIEGKVHRFEIQKFEDKWSAFAAIEIYVAEVDTQKIVWKSGTIQENSSSEKNMESAVNAMEENVKKIYGRIVEQLKQFLAQN